MRTRNRYKWVNSIGNQRVVAEHFIQPKDLEDLVKIVRRAEFNGMKVRTVGSGHSYSDIAITNEYLVDVSKINNFLRLDEDSLNDHGKSLNLVEVEAGISIQDYNEGLDCRSKAIINMGGIDEQTLAGAISTGTHGSGIELPAVSGIVKSVTLVAGGGKVYKIEPTQGITDKNKFNDNSVDELIQDDDMFNSAVVGLGSNGIIYSYVTEVRDPYWLEERRAIMDWKTLRAEMLKPDKPLFKHRAVMLRVSPYIVKNNKDHTAVVISHNEIPNPGRRTIGESTRNILASIVGYFSPWFLRAILKFPWMVKIPNMVESSMTSSKDKVYQNRAHKVLYLGQERAKEFGYDMEFAFDAHDGQKHVDVIDALIKKVNEMANKGLYQAGQIGIRYVAASDQFMTPEYKRDVCYIDATFMYGYPGQVQVGHELQEVFFQHGGIPHWGKINNRLDERKEKIPEWYPKLQRWKECCAQLDSDRTFTNKFVERYKLRDLGSEPDNVVA